MIKNSKLLLICEHCVVILTSGQSSLIDASSEYGVNQAYLTQHSTVCMNRIEILNVTTNPWMPM